MASVDNIKSTISARGGFAKPNRFKVDFSGLLSKFPSNQFGIRDIADMNIMCDSCTIPGRTLLTTDWSIWNHQIKIPVGGYDEDDIEMVFNVTNDYFIKRIFDAWLDLVVNQDTYHVGYDASYKADLIISHLDERDNEVYRAKIQGAYPLTVKPISLDNNSESTVSKFSTAITFDRYRILGIAEP